MTTFAGFPWVNPVSFPETPYWIVSVTIKDAGGHDINGGVGGAATLQFMVVSPNGGPAVLIPNTAFDSNVAAPTEPGLLSALKDWAANADWNTGFNWSSSSTQSGAVVTPVAFDSINITEVGQATTLGSDITPP